MLTLKLCCNFPITTLEILEIWCIWNLWAYMAMLYTILERMCCTDHWKLVWWNNFQLWPWKLIYLLWGPDRFFCQVPMESHPYCLSSFNYSFFHWSHYYLYWYNSIMPSLKSISWKLVLSYYSSLISPYPLWRVGFRIHSTLRPSGTNVLYCEVAYGHFSSMS